MPTISLQCDLPTKETLPCLSPGLCKRTLQNLQEWAVAPVQNLHGSFPKSNKWVFQVRSCYFLSLRSQICWGLQQHWGSFLPLISKSWSLFTLIGVCCFPVSDLSLVTLRTIAAYKPTTSLQTTFFPRLLTILISWASDPPDLQAKLGWISTGHCVLGLYSHLGCPKTWQKGAEVQQKEMDNR